MGLSDELLPRPGARRRLAAGRRGGLRVVGVANAAVVVGAEMRLRDLSSLGWIVLVLVVGVIVVGLVRWLWH